MPLPAKLLWSRLIFILGLASPLVWAKPPDQVVISRSLTREFLKFPSTYNSEVSFRIDLTSENTIRVHPILPEREHLIQVLGKTLDRSRPIDLQTWNYKYDKIFEFDGHVYALAPVEQGRHHVVEIYPWIARVPRYTSSDAVDISLGCFFGVIGECVTSGLLLHAVAALPIAYAFRVGWRAITNAREDQGAYVVGLLLADKQFEPYYLKGFVERGGLIDDVSLTDRAGTLVKSLREEHISEECEHIILRPAI